MTKISYFKKLYRIEKKRKTGCVKLTPQNVKKWESGVEKQRNLLPFSTRYNQVVH